MNYNQRHSSTDQPLKGLKLVVCGYELEQENIAACRIRKGLLRSKTVRRRGLAAE